MNINIEKHRNTVRSLKTRLPIAFESSQELLRRRMYGERDDAGLLAARTLVERLQGRVHLEIRLPPAPAKDWHDVLITRNSRANGEGRWSE